MADKANSLLFTCFRDGKVCVAVKPGLRFDEINAFTRQKIDGVPRFVRGYNCNRRLIRRRIPVEVGPRKKDLRAEKFSGRDFLAQAFEQFHASAHVAYGRDSVRDKERKNEFAAAVRF